MNNKYISTIINYMNNIKPFYFFHIIILIICKIFNLDIFQLLNIFKKCN